MATLPRTLPCKGPGLSNTDLSINKTFSIGESMKIQFRAEALNVTNTTQFSIASTSLSASHTGVLRCSDALGFEHDWKTGAK